MLIAMIEDYDRILGAPPGWKPESNGEIIGLPVRFERNGECPAMVSAWEPTPEEQLAIAAGAKIYLRVLGVSHPPVMIFTGPPPS